MDRTSRAGSVVIAATSLPDAALPSRSIITIGMRDRSLSFDGPKSEPKNAAIAIGAASVTSSARRLEK